jgi:hypothetical protein
MVLGESGRGVVLGDVRQPRRLGMLREQAEQSLAVGQVTHRGHRFGVHSGVHEPGQVAPADHAEGRVAGVDELPRGLHHVLENRVEAVGPGHRQERAQQSPQPALRALHVTYSEQQLLEKIVEFQPGDLGERYVRGRYVVVWYGVALVLVIGREVAHDVTALTAGIDAGGLR